VPTTPDETSVLEHEVRVEARPDTVFAFFTDPAKFVQWMGAEATLDPRPGGVCRIAFQPPRQRVEDLSGSFGVDREEARERYEETSGVGVMSGEFVEVDPPRRIAFTWGWEEELLALPPQSTAVEVSLTPDGEDTILRLTHRRLPADAVEFHRMGWEHYLSRLALAASGGNPGPDPWQVAAPAN
jgi:uncharacterized protein YndB with AHSA1/START domain